MSRLSKERKIRLLIVGGSVGVLLLLALFGFFIYLTIFHPDYGRVYNNYVKYQDEYFSVEVAFNEIKYIHEYREGYLYVTSPTDETYFVCGSSYYMLIESGFFDNVDEGAVLTIYTHPYIAWDGWVLPVVGIAVGDKEYIDFETGKQNWLDWLKYRSEEYGFLQTPIKQ